MGGPHVSSRARPDFCILCNKRHSPIACPKVNPVKIPISKCKDCMITSRKSNLSEDSNSMVSTITRAMGSSDGHKGRINCFSLLPVPYYITNHKEPVPYEL